uniref:Uncharacterized protein n=1 Tax=Populus trichocarpa TaxID=3694 RepID=B9NDQ2_POPTR
MPAPLISVVRWCCVHDQSPLLYMWIVNCKLEFWGIWFVRGLRWWSSETVAVVTGGNRGIGFETARQLADHGLTVILTSRESSTSLEAANVLKELGLSVDFHQLDVLDSLSIKKFAEWIEQTYGGIDVLVNNAGVNYNLGADNSVEHAQCCCYKLLWYQKCHSISDSFDETFCCRCSYC